MRDLLYTRALNGWFIVALAAGSCTLPAAATQTTSHSKGHKSTPPSSAAYPSSSHSTRSSAAKSSSAKSSTPSKTTKSSGKGSKTSPRKNSKRVKGQAAPTPERVSEIQQALTKSGSYTEIPSGKWDDSTVEAMKKFQSSHGLNPTGKLDALTLQKLGFGSETTGLAAPTPPPNATANRLLSRSAQRDELKNEDEPR